MKTRELGICSWALLGLLSGALSGIFGVVADAAETRTETISVTADRPLYAFTLELKKRHPVAVTYEEVPPRAPSAAEKAGQWAAPGALVVEFRVSPLTGIPEDMAAVLKDAIAAHERTVGDVRSKVIEDDGTFHIVPDMVRNARGSWDKIIPLLDTPIALPAQEMEVGDVLRAIRDALQRDAGAKVILAEVPVNWAINTKVRLSGRTESAREALGEALAGGRFTWQLLYDVKLKAYVFRMQPLFAGGTSPRR
jgi:hypothetical protein